MVIMWFWFVAGIAYVILGIFTYLSARRLQLMDTYTIARYPVDYWSDDDIDKMKRAGRRCSLKSKSLPTTEK